MDTTHWSMNANCGCKNLSQKQQEEWRDFWEESLYSVRRTAEHQQRLKGKGKSTIYFVYHNTFWHYSSQMKDTVEILPYKQY